MSMNPGRLGTRAFQKKSRGLDIFWWLHTIPSLKLTCSHLKNDDMETTFPLCFPYFQVFHVLLVLVGILIYLFFWGNFSGISMCFSKPPTSTLLRLKPNEVRPADFDRWMKVMVSSDGHDTKKFPLESGFRSKCFFGIFVWWFLKVLFKAQNDWYYKWPVVWKL